MKLLSALGVISHLDYSSGDFPPYYPLSDLPSPPIEKERLLFKSNIGSVPSDKQKCQPKAQHEFTIKGVNGEFYPCKPDIFAKTYEEATE